MSSTTHPVFAYLDVRQGLRRAEQEESSWKVLSVTGDSTFVDELSAELSALRQKEAHGVNCDDKLSRSKIISVNTGEGEKSLGTIGKPNVDALRALAQPSTADDGGSQRLEVSASQLTFDKYAREKFKECAAEVGGTLFPERPVKLVFDRLVLYEPGGQYIPRRDASRADNHRGTILMGCGPEYVDEGTVKLYHPGEPQDGAAGWPLGDCDWVAFSTRLEYSMTFRRSPAHIILHFDIYIEDESVERPNTVACVPPQDEVGDDGDGDEDDDDDQDETKFLSLPRIHPGESLADAWGVQPTQAAPTRIASEESLSELVRKLTGLVRPRTTQAPRDDSGQPAAKKKRTGSPSRRARTVAFVLHHLYREQTVTPDVLRGVDRALYHALRAAKPESIMKIDLHPVYVTVEAQHVARIQSIQWKTQVGLAGPHLDTAPEIVAAIPAPVLWVRREHTEASMISYQIPLSHRCDHVDDKYTWFAGAMFIYFA